MNYAIVVAAGASRRMGAQKVLLPLGQTTVIGHIVDVLERCGLDGISVVVGHGGERVRGALAGRHVALVTNPTPEAGMLSSVRCGVRALPAGWEAVLVALGDQPSIREDVVRSLTQAFDRGGGIVVPVHRGKRGHPLLVAARYAGDVLTRYDETGLRGLLIDHAADVREVEARTSSILEDMDTPEDYDRGRAAFGPASA
jgi:molybdenum cofactor cytidylyltransferase